MLPEITDPMFPQILKAIEVIVNKQIHSTVPLVMEPIMEDLVKRKFPEAIISIFPQVMLPIVEDSLRKVVKEIQSAEEKILAGGNRSNERNLLLKFLDEVSEDVLTGKEIKGREGTPLRLAIVDRATGQPIESGPESSAKVEILFLEASENDTDPNWSHEVFSSKIIEDNDMTKPRFAKSYHVYLDKGIGVLSNAKLANDKGWTKSCRCRLGARVVESVSGIDVQFAWTNPFTVSDSRSKLYEKCYPPSLSDKVWRLEHIGKDGGPCKRLEKNNVSTVEEFLFLLSVDPQRLQGIIGQRNAAWKAIVAHAQTCNIDDKRLFVYSDSSEHNISVVFDVVGGLKGVIIGDSNYVLIDHVSEAEKNLAHKSMLSAFENRKDIKVFSSEMALVTQFPSRGSYDVPNTSIHGGVSRQAEAPESRASACQQLENSNLARDFAVQHINPESEPNPDQERGGRGGDGDGDGVGINGNFSSCPSQFLFARNTPIQKISGYIPKSPENINHCEVMVSGGTSPCPSVRPMDANTALDFNSHGSKTIEQSNELHSECFESQGYAVPILDCEKHEIPSPNDEVCRLVNIRKHCNIEKRLQDHGIHTVEDFLIRLLIDPQGLQMIVEMEQGKWSDTVKNARACSDKRMYSYTDFQKRAVIVFTILGEVLSLYNLDTTRNTPENHKVEAQALLASACNNWEAVNRFDDEYSFWEHLTELNKNLDPLYLQVPAPIYEEFGGGAFDIEMADVVEEQPLSFSPLLLDEAIRLNTDECFEFWDY